MRCRPSCLLARQQRRRIDPAGPEILRVSLRSSATSTGPSLNRIGGLAARIPLLSGLSRVAGAPRNPKKPVIDFRATFVTLQEISFYFEQTERKSGISVILLSRLQQPCLLQCRYQVSESVCAYR
jgi:hypothetical protein